MFSNNNNNNNNNLFAIDTYTYTCIGWRGDLQKPPGLYKGGHLLMHGDYISSNIIVGLLDIGLKYRCA